MSYTNIRIKNTTNTLLDDCVNDFLQHHPEFKEIPISRNKIIFEIATIYLKVK